MNDKKRNRSVMSSTSEIDSSINESPSVNPKKKQNKKKATIDAGENTAIKTPEEHHQTEDDMTLQVIKQELCLINTKLANVMQKDDNSIRTIIKETIAEMKEELLKSVEKKIDILESRLFEKEVENDWLKKEIRRLDKQIDVQSKKNKDLCIKLEKNSSKIQQSFNKTEQYSRLNNLRINGLAELLFDKDGQKVAQDKDGKMKTLHQKKNEDRGKTELNKIVTEGQQANIEMSDNDVQNRENRKLFNENADQTMNNVITMLNKNIPSLRLKECDIDMCHRLGKPTEGRPRQVIIKFTSRMTRNKVYEMKKNLPRPIFLTEDLTKLNHEVFLSVKSKQPDEIDKCWTKNGDVYYKNKVGNIHKVNENEYNMWLDMPWPKVSKK